MVVLLKIKSELPAFCHTRATLTINTLVLSVGGSRQRLVKPPFKLNASMRCNYEDGYPRFECGWVSREAHPHSERGDSCSEQQGAWTGMLEGVIRGDAKAIDKARQSVNQATGYIKHRVNKHNTITYYVPKDHPEVCRVAIFEGFFWACFSPAS